MYSPAATFMFIVWQFALPAVTLPAGIDPTWDTGIFQPPTNLGDENEPVKARILLPLIAR